MENKIKNLLDKVAKIHTKQIIERTNKMKEYLKETNKINGGIQLVYKFENRWGASVIQSPHSYGGDKGLWEIGILNERGNLWSIKEITGDDTVIGYLTWNEVLDILEKIKNYKWDFIPKSERHYVEREFDLGLNIHFESETVIVGQGVFSKVEISKSLFKSMVDYAKRLGWLDEKENSKGGQMKITLRAARVNAGYSQTEAAELIGVHLQSVWNWENGKAIYQVHLEKAAELYGVPISKLIYKKSKREKKRNVEKN